MTPSNPKLKNTTVLDKHSLIIGLPVEILAITALFSVFGVGLLISLGGLFWGLILGSLWITLLFMPMRALHKHDPQAWKVWINTLQHASLSPQTLIKKDIRVMQKHRVTPFTLWRKK